MSVKNEDQAMDNRNARIENAFPMAAVRLEGFEPPTPGSEDQCSDPLSYRRANVMTCQRSIKIIAEIQTACQFANPGRFDVSSH